MFHKTIGLVGVVCLCSATLVLSDDAERSPRDWLNLFSKEWRETDWQQNGRFQPGGYMRPHDDAGWQARMQAIQGFVQQGDGAIPLLLETLKNDDTPQRILAAQTLGYLGANVPGEPLVAALKSEDDAAVRLYLVDSLGMLGQGKTVDWNEFLKTESNRDVKRHVGYVQERNGKPLASEIVETLTQWDGGQSNTAMIGELAPEFTLSSAQGDTVSLNDFRGKKAVVLVFIYGDT